ncbi:ubiquinone-binding protein [Oleiphilus sp. HI0081]|uniref:type II toxin-antitoxin system RatA family toxin n=2 Tax=Oleiphilus TaxID=141450 RepID=UPI0007C38352|nr:MULTISPECIES: type II toxin-antitoxin system RatA family toxin [unclassified Oleiphilus]KZY51155.1 ubiquinone-binding protein [Oleiphilus sp. HI0050]KZY89105.1 ubiquinone-binding protein [Oleiphilus sp. HI0072]KZZ13685.1 ubiquinone-binding protein [Oleiphilus sp. HI0078]KZZ29308.1 ubiquinone-binding protein [Oleiphilus sp. HI0081]KZY38472.1 ubiquinone-binding protein [Oleiphilus sp. HI0043]
MSLSINRSALVMHSAERMSALVNDVAAYSQFLPWCSSSQVLESESEYMLASIEVQKGALKQSFTTRNDLSEDGRIIMSLVEGPFSYLKGAWEFIHLKEGACKVELTLDFEIKQNLAKMAFAKVFNQAANSMVDAFCERANQLYR